jgi:hypothetical protein
MNKCDRFYSDLEAKISKQRNILAEHIICCDDYNDLSDYKKRVLQQALSDMGRAALALGVVQITKQ